MPHLHAHQQNDNHTQTQLSTKHTTHSSKQHTKQTTLSNPKDFTHIESTSSTKSNCADSTCIDSPCPTAKTISAPRASHASQQGIIALALSAFCMGVTEFIVAGILPDIADYFMISQPVAGWLVTIYAIGVVIGAPILTIPISKLDRKYQLMINLGIFLLANCIIAVSENFYLSLFARFVAGCMHGVFFVIATIAAVKIAKPGKENTALALMVSGLTIALVTGIPLGTFVGQQFGFQAIFWLIVGISAIALCSVWAIMPRIAGQKTFIKHLLRALSVPKLLRVYIITACTCGASFVIYTYIAELLLRLSAFDKESIASILLLYGGSAVAGNLLGGKITDSKGSVMSLRLMLSAQIFIYALMTISAYSQVFVLINLTLMGMVAFASISPLKSLAILSSHIYAKGFEDSAISVNEGAFNVGIACASALGGAVFAHLGIEFNAIFAALFALPALCIVFLIPRSLSKA